MATVTGISRHSLIEHYSLREDLVLELRRKASRRIATVRKYIGPDLLTPEDVLATCRTALALGVDRALLNRMEDEYPREWWKRERAKRGLSTKNRTHDLRIIRTVIPDFEDMEVKEALTDAEVLSAAQQEFRDLIAGPDSDYYLTYQRFSTTHGDHIRSEVNTYQLAIGKDDHGHAVVYDVVDPEAHKKVENTLTDQFLYSEQNVFGPGITRVATLAIKYYGRAGIYWLASWLFFGHKQHADLLRAVGLGWELGDTESERIKRDFIRKLPKVHEHMIEILQADPVLAEINKLLRDEMPLCNPPPLNVSNSTVQSEREIFMARQRDRMVHRVVEEIADARIREGVLNDAEELTDRFVHAQWPDFLKYLNKRYC